MNSAIEPQARQRHGRSPWEERSSRLFEELRAPARAMVRRAFGSTLDDHTIEDIYASAWLGTLRNLEQRQARLDDDEIRRYLFTAVARHASKELRRRRRRPVAPLENPELVGDGQSPLEDRADQAERSRVTRDLLGSLPHRRRAVLLLRYGWGLEPRQVCELIGGLSHRAYRKEITRGVDQLAERVRQLEDGRWCADREPILKAFAAGLADADETRQAQHHLAHCRPCADFVAKLSGHLHDLGGAVALPVAAELAAHGRASLADRLGDLVGRARDSLSGAFARGGEAASEPGVAIGSVAARGAGAAGAGAVAKLAGIGLIGKAAIACLGGGAAAVVCLAGGFAPLDVDMERRAAAPTEQQAAAGDPGAPAIEGILPSQLGRTSPAPVEQPPSEPRSQGPEPPGEPAPPPEPPAVAAVEQFGPGSSGSDVDPGASGDEGSSDAGSHDRSPAQQVGGEASCSSSCEYEASLESSTSTVRP